MKRYLVIAPIAVAVCAVAFHAVPAASVPAVRRIVDLAVALWTTAASLAAAHGFGRDDLLRKAWLANAGSFLANGILTFSGDPVTVVSLLFVLQVVLVVATNVLAVLTIWTFGYAYRSAGIEFPGSARKRRASTLLALAVAAGLAGVPFVKACIEVARGELGSIIAAASSAGDIATFVVLVPIFFAVLALRGGLLVWTWSFLFASNALFLVYDVQVGYGGTANEWTDLSLVAASALCVSAALAQRRILVHEEEPI